MKKYRNVNYSFDQKSQITYPFDYIKKKVSKRYNMDVKKFEIEPKIWVRSLDKERKEKEEGGKEEEEEEEEKGKEPLMISWTAKQPVIAVMGHIDHGKTTLLDTIRMTKVAESEPGGITQHLSCYQHVLNITRDETSRVTWMDTPGHEVFFTIRSNSAMVADMIVLVVDIVDGIRPQTLEVIRKAHQLQIPLFIAVNKIDVLYHTHFHGISHLQQKWVSTYAPLFVPELSSSSSSLSSLSQQDQLFVNDLRQRLDDIAKQIQQCVHPKKEEDNNNNNNNNDDDDDDDKDVVDSIDIIPISAKYGINVTSLLSSIWSLCLVMRNDVQNRYLDAPSGNERSAYTKGQAIVLEVSADEHGVYLVLLGHMGTLHTDDFVVSGAIAGKIRRMADPVDHTHVVTQLNPGVPCRCYLKLLPFVKRSVLRDKPPIGEVMFVLDLYSIHTFCGNIDTYIYYYYYYYCCCWLLLLSSLLLLLLLLIKVLEYRQMVETLRRAANVETLPIATTTTKYFDSEGISSELIEQEQEQDEELEWQHETMHEVHVGRNAGRDALHAEEEELEEQIRDKFDNLHKAVILRCDTHGSMTVLKRIFMQSQVSGELSSTPFDRVKIISSRIGDVTKDDLELCETINQSRHNDECRIYMFNVQMTADGKKWLRNQTQQKQDKKTSSSKLSQQSSAKSSFAQKYKNIIRSFNVYYEAEKDIYNWLKPKYSL
ncbi:translation initiation factor IF-2 [Reticulomyxa filosa]|uniref:Translation initiation factor IF-2 n=1 Tax=Reticulomyxa filosa TaxID=46433 RepID=X6N4C0_RETFI|nr:translation initiation factor IF-2 [Reticulomyxa filosa]|eukprot:ETO20604.1 translation initiation factor IF-2 [Reticulomyxa filosa]